MDGRADGLDDQEVRPHHPPLTAASKAGRPLSPPKPLYPTIFTTPSPVKRNRFIALEGAVKSVNRELEEKARTLAGIKGYKTNLTAIPSRVRVASPYAAV